MIVLTEEECKTKQKAYMIEYRQKNKEYLKTYRTERKQKRLKLIDKIKSERGCKLCRERRPWRLDFHHEDPVNKVGTVSCMATRTMFSAKDVLTEIEKCIVLCKHCHADLSWAQRGTSDANFSIEEAIKLVKEWDRKHESPLRSK